MFDVRNDLGDVRQSMPNRKWAYGLAYGMQRTYSKVATLWEIFDLFAHERQSVEWCLYRETHQNFVQILGTEVSKYRVKTTLKAHWHHPRYTHSFYSLQEPTLAQKLGPSLGVQELILLCTFVESVVFVAILVGDLDSMARVYQEMWAPVFERWESWDAEVIG